MWAMGHCGNKHLHEVPLLPASRHAVPLLWGRDQDVSSGKRGLVGGRVTRQLLHPAKGWTNSMGNRPSPPHNRHPGKGLREQGLWTARQLCAPSRPVDCTSTVCSEQACTPHNTAHPPSPTPRGRPNGSTDRRCCPSHHAPPVQTLCELLAPVLHSLRHQGLQGGDVHDLLSGSSGAHWGVVGWRTGGGWVITQMMGNGTPKKKTAKKKL